MIQVYPNTELYILIGLSAYLVGIVAIINPHLIERYPIKSNILTMMMIYGITILSFVVLGILKGISLNSLFIPSLSLLISHSIIYPILFMRFKLGPIHVAFRDRLLAGRVLYLNKRRELEIDKIQYVLEIIWKGVKEGNKSSHEILKTIACRSDSLGRKVRDEFEISC